MNFQQTLHKHLQAIQDRDLDSLAATVAPDGLVLIMADGKLVRTTEEFLDAHRGWFAMQNWTLDVQPIQTFESPELAVAVLRLDYREPPSVHSQSYLTLVFQRRHGQWLMVQDQNTPKK